MKTIVITGGAGFIGSNLIERLLLTNTCNIICIDNLITGSMENIKQHLENPQFVFIQHDICKPFELPVAEVDEIYHLACLASPVKYKKYPIETLNSSIQGTQTVLQWCIKYKCKMIFTSTSEVYGDPLVHPQPEEYFGNVNTVGERSCYDEGKRVCETMLYEYRKAYSLDLKIVRLFNTYGPRMDIEDGRVITNFINKILCGEPIEIYGDGSQTRSFCYIDDMLNALILMMASGEQGPINLGNPYCEFSLNELVGLFEKEFNKKLDVVYLERTQDDPKVRKPVIDKAINRLRWSPVIRLEYGIEKTVKYFTQCKNERVNR